VKLAPKSPFLPTVAHARRRIPALGQYAFRIRKIAVNGYCAKGGPQADDLSVNEKI
jgi:hypothetical protein